MLTNFKIKNIGYNQQYLAIKWVLKSNILISTLILYQINNVIDYWRYQPQLRKNLFKTCSYLIAILILFKTIKLYLLLIKMAFKGTLIKVKTIW